MKAVLNTQHENDIHAQLIKLILRHNDCYKETRIIKGKMLSSCHCFEEACDLLSVDVLCSFVYHLFYDTLHNVTNFNLLECFFLSKADIGIEWI